MLYNSQNVFVEVVKYVRPVDCYISNPSALLVVAPVMSERVVNYWHRTIHDKVRITRRVKRQDEYKDFVLMIGCT